MMIARQDRRPLGLSYRSKNVRRGISLLELAVTLPSATMLIGCLGMCIGLVIKAKNQDEKLFQANYSISDAISRISADLESMISLASVTAERIEFTVPDRNEDGLPERIAYEWTGTSGAEANSIRWTYNSNTPQVIYSNVGAFKLSPKATDVSSNVVFHQLSEVAVLKCIDSLPNCTFQERAINSNQAVGQYFIPEVTGSSPKWDLGEIRLMMKASGSSQDGILRVRVTGSDGTKKPTSTIHAEIEIVESSLGPSYRWVTIPFAPVSRQNTSTPLCITLTAAGGTGDVASVQYIDCTSGMPVNANRLSSTDGGSSWSVSNSTSGLRFTAYGYYDGYNDNRAFLTSVGLRLGSSILTTIASETTILLPARPELSPAMLAATEAIAP